MFGRMLAMVNRSACSCAPSAATSREVRAKPVRRDSVVPSASPATVPRELRPPTAGATGGESGMVDEVIATWADGRGLVLGRVGGSDQVDGGHGCSDGGRHGQHDCRG